MSWCVWVYGFLLKLSPHGSDFLLLVFNWIICDPPNYLSGIRLPLLSIVPILSAGFRSAHDKIVRVGNYAIPRP